MTEIPLSEVADFINGGAWNESEYSTSGVPVVRVTDCQEGTITLTNCKYLPNSGLERYPKNILYKGDLIIATVGSHLNQPGSVVGRATIVPRIAAGALLNQNAVCIRPKNNELDKRYLGHLGRSPFFREYIIARARGSANHVRMAIELLKEMPITLPSIAIQRRISEILSPFDDLIENLSEQITLLEKFAHLIQRKLYFRSGLCGIQGGLVSGKVAQIPKGWAIKELGDICEIVRVSYKEDEHFNLPLIDLAKMRQHTLAFGSFGVSKELTTSRIIFEEDDILFGSIRPYLHKVTLAPCTGITNVSVLVLRPKYDSVKAFLTILLSSVDAIKWADKHSNGLKMPVIKWDTLKTMPILMPEPSILSEFQSHTHSLLDVIKVNSYRIRSLRTSRDLLLPRILSGNLDVSLLERSMLEESI